MTALVMYESDNPKQCLKLCVTDFRVCELLEGKGGFSKGRFQGKANKLQNRNKAAQLIKDHLAAADNANES